MRFLLTLFFLFASLAHAQTPDLKPIILKLLEMPLDEAKKAAPSQSIAATPILKISLLPRLPDDWGFTNDARILEKPTLWNAYFRVAVLPKDRLEAIRTVQIGSQFFALGSSGAGDGFSSVGVESLDEKTATLLNGGPLDCPFEKEIEVEWLNFFPKIGAGKGFSLPLRIINKGKTPLTIFHGSHGGGNYLTRDQQVQFSGTLNEQKLAPRLNPPPPGFISTPFVLKPNHNLQTSANPAQYLQLDKPGKAVLEARYLLFVENPLPDAVVTQWALLFKSRVELEVVAPATPTDQK